MNFSNERLDHIGLIILFLHVCFTIFSKIRKIGVCILSVYNLQDIITGLSIYFVGSNTAFVL